MGNMAADMQCTQNTTQFTIFNRNHRSRQAAQRQNGTNKKWLTCVVMVVTKIHILNKNLTVKGYVRRPVALYSTSTNQIFLFMGTGMEYLYMFKVSYKNTDVIEAYELHWLLLWTPCGRFNWIFNERTCVLQSWTTINQSCHHIYDDTLNMHRKLRSCLSNGWLAVTIMSSCSFMKFIKQFSCFTHN